MNKQEENKTVTRLLKEIYEIANECPPSIAHKIQNRASKSLGYIKRSYDRSEDLTPTGIDKARWSSQRAYILNLMQDGKVLTRFSPEVTGKGILRLATRVWEIKQDAIVNDREYRVVCGWQKVGNARIRTYEITPNID